MTISHPEPPEATYYWEKKKYGQISDQKFHNTSVCEEDQHAKLCQKPWKYHMLITAWVAPDLLKALAIQSDATVRRSAVDWEDLKPYRNSEKDHTSLGDQQSHYLKVFQRLY